MYSANSNKTKQLIWTIYFISNCKKLREVGGAKCKMDPTWEAESKMDLKSIM
jgi:hypothetical protein